MTANDSRADEIGRRLLEPIEAVRDAALDALAAIYVVRCDDDEG